VNFIKSCSVIGRLAAVAPGATVQIVTVSAVANMIRGIMELTVPVPLPIVK
jgi:hypothetical protein